MGMIMVLTSLGTGILASIAFTITQELSLLQGVMLAYVGTSAAFCAFLLRDFALMHWEERRLTSQARPPAQWASTKLINPLKLLLKKLLNAG